MPASSPRQQVHAINQRARFPCPSQVFPATASIVPRTAHRMKPSTSTPAIAVRRRFIRGSAVPDGEVHAPGPVPLEKGSRARTHDPRRVPGSLLRRASVPARLTELRASAGINLVHALRCLLFRWVAAARPKASRAAGVWMKHFRKSAAACGRNRRKEVLSRSGNDEGRPFRFA